MGNLFSYNNKLFQAMEKIVKCMYLSILWLLFCVPVITAGAATAAMSYAAEKGLSREESIWKSFRKSFKREFKQATPLWLALLVFYALTLLDWIVIYLLGSESGTLKTLFYVLLVIAVVVKAWSNYWFPYIARYKDTTVDVLQKTGYMAIMNLKSSLLLLLVDVMVVIAAILAFFYFPIILPAFPAAQMWGVNAILQKVFAKYASDSQEGNNEATV